MFNSAGKRLRSAAMLATAAALTVGGVAVAQQNGGSQEGHGNGPGKAGQQQQGPPPLGLPMQELTYAQLHVEHKGQAQTIRLDQGKVVSVSESSITISENDGSEVTIPVDEDTKVQGRPGAKTELSDLKAGQVVDVCSPEGGTAKTIIVVPKQGKQGGSGEGEQGPPQGGQGPQGQGGQLGPPQGEGSQEEAEEES
ncbi:MAG TPA: hypothetical protein VGF95_08785 [Solirubrobacteraceae bacterium]|jgi:hypothetical protein